MLARLRRDRSVAEVCREHPISDTLFYSWRDKLPEGRAERLSGTQERTDLAELHKEGHSSSALARILQISREAIYRWRCEL